MSAVVVSRFEQFQLLCSVPLRVFDHPVPVLQSLGLVTLCCLYGLVLEAMAFSSDFVTAVTQVEPLPFNVCKDSMSIGIDKAIGG
ncbi:MAG: hypothetical protein CMK50_01645 [Propionibacteriaceae bacterium]|nr:hypothetical protein [Propionibacteriaceae bacterium]